MSFIKKLFAPKFTRKILSSLLLLTFIIPAVYVTIPPQKAHAQWFTFDGANLVPNWLSGLFSPVTGASTAVSAAGSVSANFKTFVLDGIATALAQSIVKGVTAQTVNWINSGFNGNPAYLTDPGKFFLNTTDQSIVGYLGTQGTLLNQICTPFRPQLRLALVQNYLQEGQMGQCSIQNVIRNYEAFTQDFSQGGWQGWFSMTQNMSNNPYGAYIQAQDTIKTGLNAKVQKYQNQINNSQGFLNHEVCPKGKTYAEVNAYRASSGVAAGGNCGSTLDCREGLVCGASMTCEAIGIDNADIDGVSNSNFQPTDCTVTKETVTPGSVLNDQLKKSLGSGIDKLNLVNSINQIFNALMVQAVKGIFGGITNGLRGLSQPGSGTQTKSLTEQLGLESDPDSLEGRAANNQALGSIKENIPSSLEKAIDPEAIGTPVSAPEGSSEDDLNNKVDAEAGRFMSKYPSGSNSTSGGGVAGTHCTTSSGIQSVYDSNGVCIE